MMRDQKQSIPIEKSKNIHVLVVDDSLDIRLLVRKVLVGEGFQVSSAANGEEALQSLRLASNLPDLILLDWMMPVMDGHQFRSQQVQEDKFKHIPTVLMTAVGDHQACHKIFNSESILKKPFADIDTIIDIVYKNIRETMQ